MPFCPAGCIETETGLPGDHVPDCVSGRQLRGKWTVPAYTENVHTVFQVFVSVIGRIPFHPLLASFPTLE